MRIDAVAGPHPFSAMNGAMASTILPLLFLLPPSLACASRYASRLALSTSRSDNACAYFINPGLVFPRASFHSTTRTYSSFFMYPQSSLVALVARLCAMVFGSSLRTNASNLDNRSPRFNARKRSSYAAACARHCSRSPPFQSFIAPSCAIGGIVARSGRRRGATL